LKEKLRVSIPAYRDKRWSTLCKVFPYIMEDIDKVMVSYTPSHETYKYRLNKTIESLKLEHNKKRKLAIF